MRIEHCSRVYIYVMQPHMSTTTTAQRGRRLPLANPVPESVQSVLYRVSDLQAAAPFLGWAAVIGSRGLEV